MMNPFVNANDLMTLKQASELGYGNVHTLLSRCMQGRLISIKPGRDWLTTELWLRASGYTNNPDQTSIDLNNPQDVHYEPIEAQEVSENQTKVDDFIKEE